MYGPPRPCKVAATGSGSIPTACDKAAHLVEVEFFWAKIPRPPFATDAQILTISERVRRAFADGGTWGRSSRRIN